VDDGTESRKMEIHSISFYLDPEVLILNTVLFSRLSIVILMMSNVQDRNAIIHDFVVVETLCSFWPLNPITCFDAQA